MHSLIRPQVYLGSTAPNFQASTSQGPLDFHEFVGDSWCLFFSHPGDFTPICTTEIGALSQLFGEFANRNCKMLGLSTNSRESHLNWIKDIEQVTGCQVKFPIICDEDRKISTTFGMIDFRNMDQSGKPIPIRCVYIIDPKKEIRLLQVYPLSTGRNTAEILRCLDSLQLVDKKTRRVMTPINWIPGDDVVVAPELTKEEAQREFPDHREIKPYLRLTPMDPDE